MNNEVKNRYVKKYRKKVFVFCYITEETETGKEISLLSHSFLPDNYEIYVRAK